MSDTVTLLGIAIDNLDLAAALQRFDSLVRARRPALVVTPNVDHLINLQTDVEFRRIYAQAALVLADGMPLLWAARFLGTPLRAKLSGSDVFADICALATSRGYRMFFLGGRDDAAERAAALMRSRFPGLHIDTYAPPFGFERDATELARIEARLVAAAPDILMIGLGSPKQERFAAQHAMRLAIPVSMGIGVTFEYTAGMVRRAPVWMQRNGLEWLFRLAMEPTRLWRRYVLRDPQFFWLILKQRWQQPSRR